MKRMGVDLGKTVVDRDSGNIPFVDCFDVLSRLSKKYEIFIISRVNSEQRERSLKWLDENKFFIKTGIKDENLYYCFDRRDKSLFAKALDLDIFIDDRPDCLYPMDSTNEKYLFRPTTADLKKFECQIKDKNIKVVLSWIELESKLCN